MIIVRLKGGLGNQMFQYAAGRSIAHARNTELKMDLSILLDRSIKTKGHVFRDYDLDIFNIEEKFASPEEVSRFSRWTKPDLLNRVLNRALGYKKSYVPEPHFHYSPAVANSPDNILLDGYWQTAKYFSSVEAILRREFSFRNPAGEPIEQMIRNVQNANSVCVNVRRGDFLVNSNHGFCGLPYYQQAKTVIDANIEQPHYFVFSDEIEWCEQNLGFFGNVTFVTHEYAGHKFQDYLRIMQHCKHYIIPNSSFAWWAVWLNNDKKKIVIAPSNWYKGADNTADLYNPEWIII